MLKIFLSSTFRDLKDTRGEIITKLDSVFQGVGMEKFIPRGKKSQEVCISDLNKSEVVIFLISPYYGSLIENCVLRDDCKADKCPMKTGTGHISYTNCEYNITKVDRKLHMTYYVQKGWEPVEYISGLTAREIEFYSDNLNELKEVKFFEGMSNDLINHYLKISKEACKFSEQVKNDEHIKFISDIEDLEFINMVGEHLAKNIIDWHRENELKFSDFCDRASELDDILENINGKLEVYGVGGIGKTALIQIALLIQRLKGKDILTIGLEQSYSSGSGYKDFREKCRGYQHEIKSNIITIHDIVDALASKLPNVEEIREKSISEISEILQMFIKSEENLFLFIDDFHNADEGVRQFAEKVNKIVFSSRKKTGLARTELCILGIEEENRNDFITLLCSRHNKSLSTNAKKRVLEITDGHPVSTELIVRNSEFINFDKLHEFGLKDDLKNVDSVHVDRFLKRVVEEILSDNAYILLNNLSLLNVNLERNIHRESVEESFNIPNINRCFNELIATGMLKKKEDKEGIYEFTYKHVKGALEDITDKEQHEKLLKYYEKKIVLAGDNINDAVEILYHKVKSNLTEELINEFNLLRDQIQPVHYGFKRFITVGEELQASMDDANKGSILNRLGRLYYRIGRFDECEKSQLEALKIFRELTIKDPNRYLINVGHCQLELGVLYEHLNKFERAESAHLESLKIYKEFAEKDPDTYTYDVARSQHGIGSLYSKWNRFHEAEKASREAITVYRKLAESNPKEYLKSLARALNNLGNLYWKLERFPKAETAYKEALGIGQGLAATNPDTHLLDVALTQNNLAALHHSLGRFEEAETAYTEALDSYKKLAATSPDAHLVYVMITQINLGQLNVKLKRFEKGERMINEALDFFKPLFEKTPKAYRPYMAEVWYSKACLESARENKEKSIGFLKKAIKLDKKYIEEAKKNDEYFDNLKDSNVFKELIGI